MKKICLGVLVAIGLAGCVKTDREIVTPPEMHYTDLHDAEVTSTAARSIDVNQDGTMDFTFNTLLVGDPILKRDRLQFYAGSKVETYLLNDAEDQSPRLDKFDLVELNHPGYTWYEISAIVLVEKIMPETGIAYWYGDWRGAFHHYLPIQVKKGGQLYLGWVELSFDTTGEKLILHQAALSKEAGKRVTAGVY